jgi:D-serine deaminase-like pyridoxal phosphate-dependent protein
MPDGVSESADDRLKRYRKALLGRRAPLAWVDLDLLEQNAKEITARLGAKKLRVGTKSIRSRGLLDLILKWNPTSEGCMVLSATEAVWLASLGYKNLVVGYPSVNPDEIKDVFSAVSRGASITLMADRQEHLDLYQRLASQAGVQLNVWIDVDASTPIPGVYFGVHRSSLTSLENLRELLKGSWPSLLIDGYMTYEAQIAGVQDRPPQKWQGPLVRWLKRRSVRILEERRRRISEILAASGYLILKANGGGTGSLRTTSVDPSISEITVGSGYYSPALFDFYDDFHFAPAAGFAVEVTRHSHENIWTCYGGGYPASGTGPDRAPTPYLPNDVSLLENEGAGEVQTPVFSKRPLALGELVFFRHAKAGELCERFNELHLIRGDKVVDIAKTYRGEGKTFA